MEKNEIEAKLTASLKETNFVQFGKRYRGKVRDVYDLGKKLLIITTDRQSAFDRNLATIPFKGQVLNETSRFWFEHTEDIVKNHVIDYPDPNAMVVKKAKLFPIEFVMRGFLTGITATSAWTAYAKGKREYCGHTLPEGMVKNQAFEKPLLTPTTKSAVGDEKISAQQILERGLMSADSWEEVSSIAHKLFLRGKEIADQHGLILADTKYELGLDEDGNVLLCDELHTPDSSRYWIKDSYQERFARGEEPESIDKEFFRLWFKEHCDPYSKGTLPEAPQTLVVELSRRYLELFERITGRDFQPGEFPIAKRLEKNLQKLYQK